MLQLQNDPRGVILPVRAHAGARRTGIAGLREGMLRVAVAAAPENGKANRAIVAVLSDVLSVPKSAIELLSGAASPKKRFLITGLSMNEILRRLTRICGEKTGRNRSAE